MSEVQIDFDHLNKYVGGDVALTREIFGLFVHQTEMWGQGLDPAADDEVWESVTHSLKGSAKAVGAVLSAAPVINAELAALGSMGGDGTVKYTAPNR